MLKLVTLLSVFLLLSKVNGDSDAPLEPPHEDSVYDSYRLPTAVTPENYKLDVTTHLNETEGFLFRGSVWITVRTKTSNSSQYCTRIKAQ